MTHLKLIYLNQLLKNIHNKCASKFSFQGKLGLSAVFYAQCGLFLRNFSSVAVASGGLFFRKSH